MARVNLLSRLFLFSFSLCCFVCYSSCFRLCTWSDANFSFPIVTTNPSTNTPPSAATTSSSSSPSASAAPSASASSHTNNWAVIVSTSRYWFNYRHTANALSLYHVVRSLGIPDSQIILMLPDDYACNPRNPIPAAIFNSNPSADPHDNLYGASIEVDYRGSEVTVESFLRLLTLRPASDSTPRSKLLLTDENTNLLIYMSGHGGAEFLKFQDSEEVSSRDIADALEQMHKQRRYKEILFMVDTCQAGSLHSQFYSPSIISIGSSKLGQNSYSYSSDPHIGLSTIDRFTYYTLQFFQRNQFWRQGKQSKQQQHHTSTLPHTVNLRQLFESFSYNLLLSDADWREDLYERKLEQVPLTDFFSAVSNVRSSPFSYPLTINAPNAALPTPITSTITALHHPKHEPKSAVTPAIQSTTHDNAEVIPSVQQILSSLLCVIPSFASLSAAQFSACVHPLLQAFESSVAVPRRDSTNGMDVDNDGFVIVRKRSTDTETKSDKEKQLTRSAAIVLLGSVGGLFVAVYFIDVLLHACCSCSRLHDS